MALNFPNLPINGEIYSENGLTWVYDSSFSAWFARSTANTFSIAAFDKANTAQTIGIAAFDKANNAQTIGIAAFDKANNALPNTSGVSFAGDLYFPTGNVGIGTSSPSGLFDVTSSSSNRVAYFKSNSTDYVLPITIWNSSVSLANGGQWGIGLNGSAPSTFSSMPSGSFWIHKDGTGALMTITPTGNVGIGTSSPSEKLEIAGNVTPASSNTYDLGTSSLRWRNIYTNDLNLNNGIGDYTIVEGEDDLFLYNNKKGKVYKFALVEVDPSEAPKKAT